MLIVDLKAVALFQPAHHRVVIGLLAHAVAVNRVGGALLYGLYDAGGAGKIHVRHLRLMGVSKSYLMQRHQPVQRRSTE